MLYRKAGKTTRFLDAEGNAPLDEGETKPTHFAVTSKDKRKIESLGREQGVGIGVRASRKLLRDLCAQRRISIAYSHHLGATAR